MNKIFFVFLILLLFYPAVLLADDGPISQKTTEYLKHSEKTAQKLFEEKCTQCHSAKQALSKRTYLDWKDGIAYRHGKSEDWLSDYDARNIFMHLVVHLEPEVKESALSQSGFDKTNWRFILVYLIGILAYCFLVITFLIGSVKSLRRRFFRWHRFWASFTITIASVHVLYVFYFFFLK
ncbi:MAG: hypothetical protein J7M20_01090 [Deltaproteobacteria bacterium]|nr:hypothetical protein [Deltaproteobacteria bacterium]